MTAADVRRWVSPRGPLARVAVVVACLGLLAGCEALRIGPDPVLTVRLDEILGRLDDTGAFAAARVVELPSRRELYAREADRPVTPASNMKLLPTAAALDFFGPQATFKTYLALDGSDLWVIGTGDPATGDPRLCAQRGEAVTALFDRWADALLKRGVREVRGDLVYYDGALDGEWTHGSWRDGVLHWYGAPISGLNFNDNCVDITVFPSQPGQPARYEVVPESTLIRVVNEAVTAEKHEPTIEKRPGENVYVLGGTVARREALKSKPVDDPGAFFADVLRLRLAAAGLVVRGQVRRATEPLGGTIPPPKEAVVAVNETPIADVLNRINTNSQNMFADALTKMLGGAYAARKGSPAAGSWSDGERAIRAFLQKNDIDDDGLVVADGSGLSPDNKVTARLISDVLAVMHRRKDGPLYRDSLAKGGVNGTLEKRFADEKGKVFAKTGYIGGVRSLSGYVHTDQGRWLAFAILYNKIPGNVKPFEDLQDEAVKLLVRGPPSPSRWPLNATPRPTVRAR